MHGIPTLDSTTCSLETVRAHWLYLFVQAKAEPLAAPFVPQLAVFEPKWDAADKQETSLLDAISVTQAAAVVADRGLNRLADQVSTVIHDGKKPDLSLPLHQLFFGTSAPHVFKRPTLGAQLALQRNWPALLAGAPKPALQALVSVAKKAVDAGDQAEKDAAAAEVAWNQFRIVGARKQLVDTYNALAASTYGGLRAIVHDHPELELGTHWAESFFLHSTRSHGPTTVAQAKAIVDGLTVELEAAQGVHDGLVAQAADAEAAQAAAEAAVADAKQAKADAKQKSKEAKAAVKKARKAKKA